jgi:uncharacterized protein YeeX (DUF496 family)
MEHPFILSLTDKSLEELQDTISGLYSKLTYASRTGNQSLVDQINMVIESYRKEYNKRMDDMIKKQTVNTKISIEAGKN